MKIVVDTSIFIDYARAKKGIYPHLVGLTRKHNLYVPTIVIAEFWAGEDMKSKKRVESAEKLFKVFKRVDLNEQVAMLAGELIRKKVASGFDAIIAATALDLKANLATKNTKHFTNIPNLKLY